MSHTSKNMGKFTKNDKLGELFIVIMDSILGRREGRYYIKKYHSDILADVYKCTFSDTKFYIVIILNLLYYMDVF